MQFFYILVAITLILDQGTKYLTQTYMYEGQSIPIIDGIFHLTYVLNPGAAFGILANKTTFFILVTLIVLIVIIYIYRRVPAEKWLLRFGLAMQVGGAMGNLLDRIRLGMVVDFFDFRVFPVFNIADSAIVVGVTILFIEILFFDKEGKEA